MCCSTRLVPLIATRRGRSGLCSWGGRGFPRISSAYPQDTASSIKGGECLFLGRSESRLFGGVDELLQLLTRFEIGDLLRRHVHALASLGVSPFAGLALADAEAPEAPKLDLVAPGPSTAN